MFTKANLTTLLELVGFGLVVVGMGIVGGLGLALIMAGALAFVLSERITRK